jgi:hypothetical protein
MATSRPSVLSSALSLQCESHISLSLEILMFSEARYIVVYLQFLWRLGRTTKSHGELPKDNVKEQKMCDSTAGPIKIEKKSLQDKIEAGVAGRLLFVPLMER